ncbi:MAG: HEAT repeat domain-containing protein, partial [Deltaproteobacteria bacterium]|nr:HEAT repeat domain-containing protein [Deltaproteobacteria bacterium]
MSVTRRHGLSETEQTRAEHVDHLFALGRASVNELISLMSDSSWTVRRAVVGALSALGEDAVAPLCRWLCEVRTSEHAIAAAVDALAGSIWAGTSATVVVLLDDRDPAIVADAAAILGRRRELESAPRLAKLLAHPDDNVAVAAIEGLGTIGGTLAVDALIEVVRSKNFFRTFPALQVLARTTDPRVVTPLAELLEDEAFQFEAARALGRTGSPLAVAPLATLLSRPGSSIVRLVASALADLAIRAEWTGAQLSVASAMRAIFAPSLDRFIAALPGSDLPERIATAKVLGTIGAATTLPVLVGLLDDPAARGVATEAIRRIGSMHNDALIEALEVGSASTRLALLPIIGVSSAATQVRRMLTDEDPEIRARACEALERIGDTETLPALFHALGDANPRVGHAATAAIHALGSRSVSGLAVRALSSPQGSVRRHALRIITSLACRDAFEQVVVAVDDPDAKIAELAIGALGALDDPRVEPILIALARRPHSTLRAATMRAAAVRRSDAMTELLRRGLGDEDAWVRYYACQGLGRLESASAVHALIERLADASPQVRISAIEALSRLDNPQAWQALRSAVRSQDPDEQRAALVGISQSGQPEAIPMLLEASTAEDVATCLIALAGLARSMDARAIAQLSLAASGSSEPIRDAALSLLVERSDRSAADVLVDTALATDPGHPAHLALSRPSAVRIAAIAAHLDNADDR